MTLLHSQTRLNQNTQTQELRDLLLACTPTPASDGFAWLAAQDIEAWKQDLDKRVQTVLAQEDATMGFLEEHIHQATQEIQRKALEGSTQAKADKVPCCCPKCKLPLTDQRRLKRTIESRFGPVTYGRQYGYCRRCDQWHFPADYALGLGKNAHASAYVQEMSALLVSKMPAEQAEPVAQRLGVKISRSTLDQEARRQGQKAQGVLAAQMGQLDTWEGIQQLAHIQNQSPPLTPFTLVMEIDAWNIRERDDWGQTQDQRQKGNELSRWHWVYVATCFRLNQRAQTQSGRPVITERRTVATRLGIDALMRQLHYQALQLGLHQAVEVLVIADGAVWIWNAAAARFPQARQRLDLYHADEYLWAVANDLYGQGSKEAREFVAPLLNQVRDDQTLQLIGKLTEIKPRLAEAFQKKLDATIHYLQSNQYRMHYKEVRAARKAVKEGTATQAQKDKAMEPLGSGAIESTCRQYQCRFKRPGQFWTTVGDEALLCLESFWRNGCWEQLYPHSKLTSPMLN